MDRNIILHHFSSIGYSPLVVRSATTRGGNNHVFSLKKLILPYFFRLRRATFVIFERFRALPNHLNEKIKNFLFVNTLKIIRQTLNLIIFLQIDIKHPRIYPKSDHEFKKNPPAAGYQTRKLFLERVYGMNAFLIFPQNDSLAS